MTSHKIEPELCPHAGGRGLPGLPASRGQRADRGPCSRMGSHRPTAQRRTLPGMESREPLLLQGFTCSRYRVQRAGEDSIWRTRGFVRLCITAVYYSITQISRQISSMRGQPGIPFFFFLMISLNPGIDKCRSF